MDSTTFAALVAVAADYFFVALKATEDLDSFLRTVRSGMREAVAAAAGCVERFDRKVAAQLPREWELRGRPARTVVTMVGRVTYARSLYRGEHGRNRYPADEILGIPKRRRLTADVFLWLVARAARMSFRQTARDFAEVSGCRVSAMCPWRAMQREGAIDRFLADQARGRNRHARERLPIKGAGLRAPKRRPGSAGRASWRHSPQGARLSLL